MSQASVRQSIFQFIAAAKIPHLPMVYRAKPQFVAGQKFAFSDNNGESAICYLHFVSSAESRMTLPAVTGSKHISYKVAIVVIYQYLVRPGTAGVDEASDWVDALDGILDGLKALIRSDPTMGTGGTTTLFQGGEDAGDLLLQSQDAEQLSGVITSWNALEFFVDEIIQA